MSIRTNPAYQGADAALSNTVDLTTPTRGIYVGAAGDVKVNMEGGGTVTFKNLAAGILHPICAKRIWLTGTTANDIVVVW